MAELSRAAVEEFEKDRLVAAIVLTRAAVEASAALWYLCTKVEASLESAEVGDIDAYLMQLSMGMATDPPTDPATVEPMMPRPVKTSTFLKCVEKDIEGFSRQYGYLSEYTHLNWAGTVYHYLKFDQRNAAADFGQNIRQPVNTKLIFACSLSNAFLMFERSYNRIADIFPAL